MYNIQINLRGKATKRDTGLMYVMYPGTQTRIECNLSEIKEWTQKICDEYGKTQSLVDLLQLVFTRI